MNPIITLTLHEIIDLAEFAGLVVDRTDFTEDELEAMFTIVDCPPEGILNGGESGDPESRSHYGHFAFCTDYPEEGGVGLGPEIAQQENGNG